MKESKLSKHHKTWWDEEKHIIIHKVDGPYEEEDVNDLLKKIDELRKEMPDTKLRALLDLSSAHNITSGARKAVAQKVYKHPDLERVSAFGVSTFARVVNSFIIKASGAGSDKVRVFEKKEEALKWLKD